MFILTIHRKFIWGYKGRDKIKVNFFLYEDAVISVPLIEKPVPFIHCSIHYYKFYVNINLEMFEYKNESPASPPYSQPYFLDVITLWDNSTIWDEATGNLLPMQTNLCKHT